MFIKMMVSFLHNSVKEPNRMRQELILKPRVVKSVGPWKVIICMTFYGFLMMCKHILGAILLQMAVFKKIN